MSALSATCANLAIGHVQAGRLVQALPYFCAAQHYATDDATAPIIAAAARLMQAEVDGAVAAADLERAYRFDDFHAALNPAVRAGIPAHLAQDRAVVRAREAEARFEATDLEVAVAHCLAANALDPDGVLTQEIRRQVADEEFRRHQADLEQAPTLDATIAIAFAALLEPIAPHLTALTALLLRLGDYALVIRLCDRIAETPLTRIEEFENWRRRRAAELRLEGAEAEAAETMVDDEAAAILNGHGPAKGLDTEILLARVGLNLPRMDFKVALEDMREILDRHPGQVWTSSHFSNYVCNIFHPYAPTAIAVAVQALPDNPSVLQQWFGTAWMMGAVDQMLILSDRLSKHLPYFSSFRALHAMATDLDLKPAAVLGAPPGEGHRIHASIACWGSRYIDLMERGALATLLAPGNIPALTRKAGVVLEVFTMPADLEALKASPGLSRLARFCEVRIFLFPEAVAEHARLLPYLFFGCSSHATMLRAERAGADLLFLYPDVLYADGSLQSVANRITRAPCAIFVDGLNVYAQPMLRRFNPNGDAEALSIPSATLIDAAVEHLSRRTTDALYRPGDLETSTMPTRVIFKTDAGLRIHSFVMGPTYVSHAGYAPLIFKNFGTVDGLFASHLLYKLADDQIQRLATEEFCLVEICDGDGEIYPLAPQTLEAAVIRYFRDYGLNVRRLKLFEPPTLYPGAIPPTGSTTDEAEMTCRLAGVRQMFATHSVFVDLGAERERFALSKYKDA